MFLFVKCSLPDTACNVKSFEVEEGESPCLKSLQADNKVMTIAPIAQYLQKSRSSTSSLRMKAYWHSRKHAQEINSTESVLSLYSLFWPWPCPFLVHFLYNSVRICSHFFPIIEIQVELLLLSRKRNRFKKLWQLMCNFTFVIRENRYVVLHLHPTQLS